MASAKGNRKIAAELKEKYGIDEQGRSVFHVTIGSLGGGNSGSGYFRRLKLADPAKLKALAAKGGKASHASRKSNDHQPDPSS